MHSYALMRAADDAIQRQCHYLGRPPLIASIREAVLEDAEAIGRLHVDVWNDTYRGIMPDAVLDAMSASERARAWRQRIAEVESGSSFGVFMACLDAVPAGFAACGPQRDDALLAAGFGAEFFVINISRAAQGLGLGRRMMQAMAQAMIARGQLAASVWVVRDRPQARGFYERLGGIPHSEKIETRLDLNIVEVSYVWPDVSLLAGLQQ
jgi:GNAT superfamily N-acetyltransferase